MNSFIAAVAQYPVTRPVSWGQVEDTLTRWIAEAVLHGARLLVFPEYASLSLAGLFRTAIQADVLAQFAELQKLREDYVDLHCRLAQAYGAYLLAGSFPWQLDSGQFRNRVWLCSPGGDAGFQDQCMTPVDGRGHWGMIGAGELRLFDTAVGRVAIDVCRDIEFPMLTRQQTQAGAQMLLVPSSAAAAAGYHRTRLAAQSRALEGECYVLLSSLIGEAPWSPAVGTNIGAAGIYGPPHHGPHDDGVLVQGPLNHPCWVYAELGVEPKAPVNGPVKGLKLAACISRQAPERLKKSGGGAS